MLRIQALVREAKETLAPFSRPAIEAIREGLFGPREARFAAFIAEHDAEFQKLKTALHTTAQIAAGREQRDQAQIRRLVEMLQEATTVIEERIVDHGDRVKAFQKEIDKCHAKR